MKMFLFGVAAFFGVVLIIGCTGSKLNNDNQGTTKEKPIPEDAIEAFEWVSSLDPVYVDMYEFPDDYPPNMNPEDEAFVIKRFKKKMNSLGYDVKWDRKARKYRIVE